MYTTMNCDFLETEYYFTSQHSGQGERDCDTLSWLKWMPSSEEVNHSTQNESFQPSTQFEDPNISVTKDAPPNLTSEVSNTQSSHSSDSPEHIESVEDTIASNHETTI